ncbi:tryptophan decarboxylase TDC2-like [Telopea speciosissima]|uniref:tryptophan decarboxylase TDC2-like n=1 Tax=Telopea speciosissima TaxID=54955 RepID=UPI001CC5B3BC|nr:tryptophan decarboxylase TDC2-like [Telopea speciosissima]
MGSLGTNLALTPHSEFKQLDPEEFRKQAHQTVDFIADYYKSIESYPVLSQVRPGYLRDRLPDAPPYNPEPFEAVLKDVERDIIPGMTHWLSPNFFAYFPATVSTAAFVAEMLCTSFNSVGFTWLASPAATELETVVMDWLAKMLKLPTSFMFEGTGGGVIQGTTSEAILCTVVAARDRELLRIGEENFGKLVVYASDQTHSTYTKACRIAGISPHNIRLIHTTAETDFSLDPVLVRKTIEADMVAGLYPLYLCATVGTTSSTAIDPLGSLADVVKDYGVWLHVDAAYAGSACICPEFRQYLDGIEGADSLSVSPHKWLLTHLDCCCLWVKSPSLLMKTLSTNPEYLKNKPSELKSVVDYKDWQVGTGRRFRALRLWMVLRCCGVANLQAHIRTDIQMAKMFEGFVRADPRFEIVVPRRFALVCFRLKPDPGTGGSATAVELLNRKLLERINSTGGVYMIHSIVGDMYMLRFAVGATFTEERHVIAAWKVIQQEADAVLGEELGMK